MQPSARTLLTALAAACAWPCAIASLPGVTPAQAQIEFAPCANTNDFACGHLTVPLDPSGATPGTITLAIRRHRAPVGEARSAIIALAGGPGQPALPFAEQFDELLGPIAATRDLIVFDQRGIGLSDPLSCHAFERPGLYSSFGALIEACGDQLGGDRVFYTSADTVADIEAIRQAGGYEKLVLYGTSYGTKVAEEYAQRYPTHVEALVLDSVVPPNGPEPLGRPTFQAVPRILRQLCARHACAQITANPVADLAKVVARTARAPLSGRLVDPDGKAQQIPLSSDELVELLLAGDFSSLLRAEFLTTVAAAARGDTAPLARLVDAVSHAEGEGREDFDDPLYYATTCEEQEFPWSRSASPGARVAEATAAARALGASAFAPFTVANALDLSDLHACAHWPYTTPAPALDDAPLPNVPTLILSGADDLRTPTSGAREVAGEIPDAHLLIVPYTGHSVLSDEPTPCASEALQALFANKPIKPCPVAAPPASLKPPPLPPVRLAQVSPQHGYSGLAGRTLHSVSLTLGDFIRQLALQVGLSGSVESLLAPKLRIGGLRAGWGELTSGELSLHGYSYIPGMTLSGTIKSEHVDLQVGGSAAAHGTLRSGAHSSLMGSLEGRRVALPANAIASAAIVGDDAQESLHRGAGGALLHALAGALGASLAR
ncbi:MAG TPA: alpha/beta fold hydrolase [Solirubrobacteraceae bacterium]|nr:alpha/beta fold hydrolase [Solirubrobacteraceae bacterium]